jgi:hypothetical protein
VAGFLVACFVFFAGPISGFSMNPARTLASSIPSGYYSHLWIYLTAPFMGMLVGTIIYKSIFTYVVCAKICQSEKHNCIFNCEMCYKKKNIIVTVLFLSTLILPVFTQQVNAQTKVIGVNINVSDLDKSIAFYTNVLQFKVVTIE